MIPLCGACAGGPVSVAGHPDLRALSLGAATMAFSCLGCRALWSRTYSTTGEYTWSRREPAGSGIGASLPPTTAGNGSANATMNATEGEKDHWRSIQSSWKRPRRFPT